jgi:hypothetical protein
MAKKSDIDREELVAVTPAGRVCFPSLFETKTFDGEDTGKYGLVLVFKASDDLTDLKTIVRKAADARFGAEWKDLHKRGKFALPFRKCSEYEKQGEPFTDDPEAIFINLNSTEQPSLVDENVRPVMSRDTIYAGCFALAQVYAHAYNTKGNAGVTLFVNAVQKAGDGEKLGGGRPDPKTIFKPIKGAKPGAKTSGGGDPLGLE